MQSISVIIPVFNVEHYLDRCLLSIVNQSFTDLDIILVDDGSTDSSGELCDAWEKRDNRIRVIHKENNGLGEARNSGLEIAKGDYVSFVDSDDYLDLDTYKICIQKLEKYKADACYFNYKTVTPLGETMNENVMPEVLNKDEIETFLLPKSFGHYIEDSFYFQCSACMGVFSLDMIKNNGIRFVSERELISEDFVFTNDICFYSNRIVFVNEHFYNYWINQSSLTRKFKSDRDNQIVVFYKNRIDFIKNRNINKEALTRAAVRLWEMTIACMKYEIKDNRISYINNIKRINEITQNDTISKLYNKKILVHLNRKQRILVKMLSLRLSLFVYCVCKMR